MMVGIAWWLLFGGVWCVVYIVWCVLSFNLYVWYVSLYFEFFLGLNTQYNRAQGLIFIIVFLLCVLLKGIW